ncbi:hypothetical protein LOK49_Contig164G00003 [Camellia lanceoleosa]|nr:hypothetical protein LOK49_Contig164G00003 [Camellia lanceoleosa]
MEVPSLLYVERERERERERNGVWICDLCGLLTDLCGSIQIYAGGRRCCGRKVGRAVDGGGSKMTVAMEFASREGERE